MDSLHLLFGETPNRATWTVAFPFSNRIVPAQEGGGPQPPQQNRSRLDRRRVIQPINTRQL